MHFSSLKTSKFEEGYAGNHIDMQSKAICYLTGASLNKQSASLVVGHCHSF